jgi:cytoskeleton protein RodZ
MGPGERLRMAREARGLEVGAVASQLHLSVATLAALERDDHDALPGAVYVLGYIRSYSRLLGVAEEPLVSGLADRISQEAPLARVQRSIRSDGRSRDRPVRVVTFAILVLLAGLVFVWWRGGLPGVWSETLAPGIGRLLSTSSESQDANAMGSQPGEAGSVAAAPLASRAVEGASGIMPATTADDASEPAERSPTLEAGPEREAKIDAMGENPIREPPVASVNGEPLSGTEELSAQEGSASSAEQEQRAAPAPSMGGAEAPAFAAAREGGDTLVLAFSGDSWADVRDAGGERLLTGLFHAGSQHAVAGQPPFSIVLGNSKVTAVTFNGEPFDHSSFARGNVARFTIGPGDR